MIFFGHFSAHFPQFVHFSGSMCAMLSTTCTASDSHTFSHILHPIHPTEHAFMTSLPWTGGDTFTTGFTCFFVNYCNSVYNMDRIERTCLYAASETKTSERTFFWSSILHHGCHLAVCNSCIIICLFCFFAGSCTFYKCNFVYAFTGFFASLV